MREIHLTNGGEALVDDDDYDALAQFKWFKIRAGHTFYVRRYMLDKDRGVGLHIAMHTQILGCSPVDHINLNGLDNRKQNLRACTPQQNTFNRRATGLIGFKGVRRLGVKYAANLRVNGAMCHLGMFDNPVDAARAYDSAAAFYQGEFARLNFPDDVDVFVPGQHRSIRKGYSLDSLSGKYKVRITVNHERITVGYYDTEQKAFEARQEALKKYNLK